MIQSTPTPILEIDDLIDQLNEVHCSPSNMYNHIVNGTVATHYNEVLNYVIHTMAVMPIARILDDHDNEDDDESVLVGFTAIATAIANWFNKPDHVVFSDVVELMNDYPTDDVRTSYYMRATNTLH